MITKIIMWAALLIPIIPLSSPAQSGNQIQLTVQPTSKLWLEGTSSVHDYTAKTSKVTGAFVADSLILTEWKGEWAKLFQKVEITIPVKTLSSGDEKLDDNMYDALKADDHGNITYRMSSDSLISVKHDSITLRTTGSLTIAGKENPINMVVTVSKKPDGGLSIKGSKTLLMTNFGVDPPTFMFVLKTYDKVVVRFSLELQPHQIIPR